MMQVIFGTGALGQSVMREFGIRVTPHEEAIQRTLEWYKSIRNIR